MEFNEENFNKLLAQSEKLAESVKKLEENNKSLLSEKAAAKKLAEEAEQQAKEKEEESLKKSGDVEALLKSHKNEIARLKADYEAKLQTEKEKHENDVKELTVDKAASSLSHEIAMPGYARFLEADIKKRLINEGTDIKILDKDGNPTFLTMDDLKQEIINNPEYERLLVGTKASGAGVISNNASPATSKGFAEMTSMELVELRKTNSEKYEQLKAEYYSK